MRPVYKKIMFDQTYGFTLIDMLVATSIIVTISVVMVVNFRVGRHRDELRSGALFLASLIHQAQAYSLSGRTVEQVYPYGGWGVWLDIQDQGVALFGDDMYVGPPGDRIFRNDGSDYVETFELLADRNILFEQDPVVNYGANPNGCDTNENTNIPQLHLVYLPPSYGNSRVLNDCQPYGVGYFTVLIKHTIQTNLGMYLTVNIATGQVTLGPIEQVP